MVLSDPVHETLRGRGRVFIGLDLRISAGFFSRTSTGGTVLIMASDVDF